MSGWIQAAMQQNTIVDNVLLLHLKQTFPPIIWIFTEGEGDGIESRPIVFYFNRNNNKYEI